MIRKILLNSSSNVLVLFLKIAVTFVMAPILVRNLGNYDYGLWEMIGAVVGYMGMLDLGMGPTISRFAAKAHGENNRDDLKAIFSSALLFMIIVGIFLGSAFLVWGMYFPDAIAEPGEEVKRYSFLLLILGSQMLFVFPGRVAESYLEGFQRYDLKNNVTIINTLVGSGLLYTYITPENGLILLALINGIGASVKYIIYFYLLTRENIAGIVFRFSEFRWAKLKELLRFGSKVLVQGISSRVEYATDSLLIGYFLGPAMVPFYSIPANLVQYIRTLGHTLTHVFMPLFSSMLANDDVGLIRKTYLLGSKYTVAIIVVMSLGAITFGASFITIWIGPTYAASANEIILVLVAFTIIPFLNPFGSRYLTAIGAHGIYAKWTPISAAINIIVSCLLIGPLGILGVALGSLVPVFIFVPVYMLKVCEKIGFSWQLYVRTSVLPSVIPGLVMYCVISLYSDRINLDSYLSLVGGAIMSSVAFLLVFLVFSLGSEEKKYLSNRILKLRISGG